MPVFEYLSSILMLLGSLVGMFCGIVFIGVLTVNRHCRTSTTFFGLNSVIAGLITTFVYACQACYQLSSARRDALCVFRGFLLHATCGLLYHTFCIQAFYRLLVTIPTRRLYFRSRGVIKLLVLVQWLISATFGLPILCRGQIKFHASGRICQVSLSMIGASVDSVRSLGVRARYLRVSVPQHVDLSSPVGHDHCHLRARACVHSKAERTRSSTSQTRTSTAPPYLYTDLHAVRHGLPVPDFLHRLAVRTRPYAFVHAADLLRVHFAQSRHYDDPLRDAHGQRAEIFDQQHSESASTPAPTASALHRHRPTARTDRTSAPAVRSFR